MRQGRIGQRDGHITIRLTGLDGVTTYYLLHRYDFGLGAAPAGACILYAQSCGLSDAMLGDRLDLLARGGKSKSASTDSDDDADTDSDGDSANGASGSEMRLKHWYERSKPSLGLEAPAEMDVPLIDKAHKLMHLWKAGDDAELNDYLDRHGLRRHALFHQLLQALIELAPESSDERQLLENLSNRIGALGTRRQSATPKDLYEKNG